MERVSTYIEKHRTVKYDKLTFNCYTLVRDVYSLFGIQLEHNLIPKSYRKLNLLISKKSEQWREIPFNHRRPLDVIVFYTTPRVATHLGLVFDKKRFIHIDKGINLAVEQFKKSMLCASIKGIYRWQSN